MSYINQENVYSVASVIYNNIKQQYGVNIEGYYLEDIQKVMGKLFEKNKDKFGKNPRQVSQALNKKTVELVLPQVVRNIQEGALNKTQNAMFKSDDNPVDAFERLKKERERERESETVNVRNNGADMAPNYSAPLQNQKNIYSGNNYQNRDTTYENQLLMTKTTMKEIEPDIGAERFVEGKPIGNQRQNFVRDDGPSNNPTVFSNLNPSTNLEDVSGDTLSSFFQATANLRGENTTREFENNDVSDRFSKLRNQ